MDCTFALLLGNDTDAMSFYPVLGIVRFSLPSSSFASPK